MKKGRVIFLLAMLSIACQPETIEKEIVVEELPTFEDYYNLLAQPTDAEIVIQSFTGLGSQDDLRNNYINAYFNNEANLPNVKVGGIALVEKDGVLESSDSEQIGSIFGSKIIIEVNDPVAKRNVIQTEMYIPDLLTIANQIDRLQVGDIIEWNNDDANVNGLILKFEYLALSQISQEISNKYPDDVIAGFIVPDGGSVTITNEMLELLPNGADIQITIARGNIELLPVSDDEVYKVGGITSISAGAKVMK